MRAQAGDHLQAGQAGQAKVDDGGVERVVGREVQRLLAVAGGVHRVVLGFQLALELLPQGGFVFDYQDAHGCSAHRAGGRIHVDDSHLTPAGEDFDPVLLALSACIQHPSPRLALHDCDRLLDADALLGELSAAPSPEAPGPLAPSACGPRAPGP